MNLHELKQAAGQSAGLNANIHVQIAARSPGTTTGGKPYIELTVADASGVEKLRLWQESPAYRVLNDFPQMDKGTAIDMVARWKVNQWGLNAEEPKIRALTPDEMNALFEGGEAFAQTNQRCWEEVQEVFFAMAERGQPLRPLGVVCVRLLESLGDPLRRAAAAHGIHHARRGGLLEHTASMLRGARALAPCYPEVTPDILYAGVLFHDAGKIFETDYQEQGFALDPTLRGALMGHIAIGVTMLTQLWEQVHGDGEMALRDHVAHLILSHHGQKEWGSPVEPVTPEAILLHHLDMIDSGVEKLRNGYHAGEAMCHGAVKAVYPMRGAIGLPFNTSAAFARMHVAPILWRIMKDDQARPTETNHTIVIEWYEQKFCETLCAAGITTGTMAFLELPRSALETASRRWDELHALWTALPEDTLSFPRNQK